MTVKHKSEMYRMLAAGRFGNTVPQWFSVDEWASDPAAKPWTHWGVRSATISGHPACRLNCPTDEVAEYARRHFDGRANISPMVDKVSGIAAWLEVVEMPGGLIVEGVERPDIESGWTWRNSMPDPARRKRWHGTAAKFVLNRNLNPNARDDLEVLLDQYPGHVVELSALDRCLGTVPGRNAVIWECRSY